MQCHLLVAFAVSQLINPAPVTWQYVLRGIAYGKEQEPIQSGFSERGDSVGTTMMVMNGTQGENAHLSLPGPEETCPTPQPPPPLPHYHYLEFTPALGAPPTVLQSHLPPSHPSAKPRAGPHS